MPKNENEQAPEATLDIDALVDDLYGTVNLVRVDPTIPTVKTVKVVEEKNKAGQINGVNLGLTLSGIALIAGKAIALTAEGWKVDQVNMTRAIGTKFNDQVLWGSNVSLRFGKQGAPEATYFVEHCPGVTEITQFAEKICALADAHGIQALVDAGHVVLKNGSESQGYVQFDMSRVDGCTLYNFCSIGKDGKPVVDLTQNWSLHRQPARAKAFRIDRDTGEEKSVNNFNPNYRGTLFSKGSRANTVALGLTEQIMAKVGDDLAKISGVTREERTDSSNRSNRQNVWATRNRSSRFAPQAPKAEEKEDSKSEAPAPTANASGIEF